MTQTREFSSRETGLRVHLGEASKNHHQSSLAEFMMSDGSCTGFVECCSPAAFVESDVYGSGLNL